MKKIKLFILNAVQGFFSIFRYRLVNEADFVLLPSKGLSYSNDYLYTYHNAGFLDDDSFKKAYQLAEEADDNGLLVPSGIQWRIHVLLWAAHVAKTKEGDFVDCGGGSGIFASAILSGLDFEMINKDYYLIDSFEGLDENISSIEELERSNKLYKKITKDEKLSMIKSRFKNKRVKIIEGYIPDVLDKLNLTKISFLSLDLNSAIPEYEALNFLWDKMVSGGIIVLDDHGYLNLFPESMAMHERFAKEKGVEILKLPTCQALITKP